MGFFETITQGTGGLLGGLIGGGLSVIGQQQANAANRAIASDQMDFQRAMSNTAHQREVADLRQAGLNPILSANGGASTPAGASTTMTNQLQGLGDHIASSAKEYQEFQQSLENNKASRNLMANQANAAKASEELANSQQKVTNEKAAQEEMNTKIQKEALPTRMKLAPVQPWIDAAAPAVGAASTGLQLYRGGFNPNINPNSEITRQHQFDSQMGGN